MTDRELEEFITYGETGFVPMAMVFGEGWAKQAIEIAKEYRARLAQHEPEPVAKMKEVLEVQGRDGNWNFDPYMQGMFNGMEMMMSLVEGRDPEFRKAPDKWAYAAPPQREWQGLTDEEIRWTHKGETFYDFARAIEAKLKAKNAQAQKD